MLLLFELGKEGLYFGVYLEVSVVFVYVEENLSYYKISNFCTWGLDNALAFMQYKWSTCKNARG